MGVSKKQAVENKRAIVAAAEKLFRERGVAAVGLSELTKAAGFTQGGFYNHFPSKDALVAAVMEKAMGDGAALLTGSIGAPKDDAATMKQHIEWYLSADHQANIAQGCPLTAFAGDVRRLGPEARQVYAHGLAWNFDELAKVIEGENAQARRKKAIAMFSQMAGALTLSRAVAEADPELADEILQEAKQQLLQAIGSRITKRRTR